MVPSSDNPPRFPPLPNEFVCASLPPLIELISSRALCARRRGVAARTPFPEKEGALSEVLQDFHIEAPRPRRDLIHHEVDAGLIKTWTRFPVRDMAVAVLMHVLHITARYRLSYRDSAIVAPAHALGSKRLYSEDLLHGQKIAEVEIFNPFLDPAQPTGPCWPTAQARRGDLDVDDLKLPGRVVPL